MSRLPILLGILCIVMSTTYSFGQMSHFDKYSLQSCLSNCYMTYDPRSQPGQYSQCVESCKRTYGQLPGLDKDLPKGIR